MTLKDGDWLRINKNLARIEGDKYGFYIAHLGTVLQQPLCKHNIYNLQSMNYVKISDEEAQLMIKKFKLERL